jgi:sialate O-acetylesterase
LYKSVEVKGQKVSVKFAHVGGGLITKGGPLEGFAIAGEDKTCHWARAEIQGDSIVAWSDKVAVPQAVRYAWVNNPVCNLFNKEGLPASPFRSDSWTDDDCRAADEPVSAAAP